MIRSSSARGGDGLVDEGEGACEVFVAESSERDGESNTGGHGDLERTGVKEAERSTDVESGQ
jgi:hypothetical protein